METLKHPDDFVLREAIGWCELGNWLEACATLDQITPENREHISVLHIRFAAYERLREWALALPVAETLIKLEPQNGAVWINRSNSLHFLKRYQEAFDLLMPALDTFPENAEMRYNMACFCCRMERLEEARQWLKKAFALTKNDKLKQMALADPDLEPLWKELQGPGE